MSVSIIISHVPTKLITMYMLCKLLDSCYPCLQNMYVFYNYLWQFFFLLQIHICNFVRNSRFLVLGRHYCGKFICYPGNRDSWHTMETYGSWQHAIGAFKSIYIMQKRTVSFVTKGINKSVGRYHPQSCSYKSLNMCINNLGWLGGFSYIYQQLFLSATVSRCNF